MSNNNIPSSEESQETRNKQELIKVTSVQNGVGRILFTVNPD